MWDSEQWIISDHAQASPIGVGCRIAFAQLIQQTAVDLIRVGRRPNRENSLEVASSFAPQFSPQTQTRRR